ncbi:MAG: hypothetical protein K6T78_08800 [Alicyclobacillus sp.]|nr:hypothetical protein [Alicyclobacillus sp.]
MKRKPRMDRLDVVSRWMEAFAPAVYQFACLYTGSRVGGEDLTVRAFANALRRYDIAHLFLSDANAMFASLAATCKELEPLDGAVGAVQDAWGDVQRLRPELRALLLLYAIGRRDVADLSRILLLPGRVVLARLHAACAALHPHVEPPRGGVESDGLIRAVSEDLLARVSGLDVPEELWVRIRKVVWATDRELEAGRRHRGPRWLVYAVVCTVLFGAVAVDIGARESPVAGAQMAVNRNTPPVLAGGLPDPLQNLPVVTQAQFSLSQMPPSDLLSHVAISDTAMYFPQLRQSVNTWPSIDVSSVQLGRTGQPFDAALATSGTIPLVPPIENGVTSGDNWKIADWDFDVSGDWAYASVTWGDGNSNRSVVQVYGLYLPTGKSGLALSVDVPQGGAAVAAMGRNRVVIQTGVRNSTKAVAAPSTSANAAAQGTSGGPSGAAGGGDIAANRASSNAVPGAPGGGATASVQAKLVGLPVNVYRVYGTQPLQSLVKSSQIGAPFGLMEDPTVFPDGVLFTGISGAASLPLEPNTEWYLLNWNGDLSKFTGPPDDGQQHWAVMGAANDLWWVETTPSPSATRLQAWQVLMAPLATQSGSTPAALSLDGSVAWFTAYQSHVAWIQSTGGRLELVVSAVQ